MRTYASLWILLTLVACAFATPSKIEEDHEKQAHDSAVELIQAAEQLARESAEPPVVIERQPITISAEERELTQQLRAARQAGDPVATEAAEEALASYLGKPGTYVTGGDPGGDQIIYTAFDDAAHHKDRWLPHEFLLAGSEFNEWKPTLAADSDGNLYAVFMKAETQYHDCVIYKSTDSGEHWSRFFSYTGLDLLNPSIAIGEGVENWLFVTFYSPTSKKIYVHRQNLDNLTEWDLTTIEDNPAGSANPRIVTDCAEYPDYWYVYLVYNSMAVDNWVFLHTRSTDFGVTWDTPEIIGGYCGYPGTFYDGSQGHPDIEFGGGNLYVAWDNYTAPCTDTYRDVYLMTSGNYGSTWGSAVRLTTLNDDEYGPAIAAVKTPPGDPTVVVAYTRFYFEMDHDVWFVYTLDDGSTWLGPHCIACSTPEEEDVNLATSFNQGLIHAAYWDEFNINYAVADHTTPNVWTRSDSISTSNTASGLGYPPGILVDPTKPAAEEVGIAWTDFRNEGTMGLDIFYDGGALPYPEVDYYFYTNFDPGLGYCAGVDGFIDEAGAIEGLPGAEYIFFTVPVVYEGDITAYVYRVETAGDPETHPDNPLNTGPVATRTFTFVNSNYLGYFASAHNNAFYIDETGIYYGPSDDPRGDAPGWATFMGCAIYHWDFDWTPIGCEVSVRAPSGNQTLARNPNNGDWWAAHADRRVYRWDGATWVYQFTAPHLGGGHHDGMEIVGNSLLISDMTSDLIIQYRLDDDGNPIDPAGIPARTFAYSATAAVEGLGHGPNNHLWVSGGPVYEIGGGALLLAVEGIPDQCITPGEAFYTFDLDDYTVGVPPFEWSWEGQVELTVSVDANNVVTVTHPGGWFGQETITFTVRDGLDRLASDQAIFTRAEIPVVGDIPDQVAPFVPFDLDDYLLGGTLELISWTASGMDCFSVEIDPVTHVATIVDPAGCSEPEVITFTAMILPCGEEFRDSDDAVFDPGFSSVTEERPVVFTLGAPAPNPSHGATHLAYAIPAGRPGAQITLAVHDIAGRLVRTLVRAGEPGQGGSVTWDGNDAQGAPAPSGTYFFHLRWNDKLKTRPVMLLR